MQIFRNTKIVKNIPDSEVWEYFFKRETKASLLNKQMQYCLCNYFQVNHCWVVTKKGTFKERTILVPTGAYFRSSKLERSEVVFVLLCFLSEFGRPLREVHFFHDEDIEYIESSFYFNKPFFPNVLLNKINENYILYASFHDNKTVVNEELGNFQQITVGC